MFILSFEINKDIYLWMATVYCVTGWCRFLFMIEHVMPLCLTISWVYTVAMLVQSVVYEKEQRLKEVRLCNTCILHTLCWQLCNRPHPIPVASTFPKMFVKSTYLHPKLSVRVRIRGLQPIATRCHLAWRRTPLRADRLLPPLPMVTDVNNGRVTAFAAISLP